MNDKHIDDIIKDALQELNVPYRPESWDAMQQRMDGIESDDVFDEYVHDEMNSLHTAYAPASWDSMQKRMDAELNDSEFDTRIKSQISDIDATYRHKNWLQLKEWLDYQWFASNKVYVSKSAEAVLMLLALFTFFNYNTGLVEPIQSKVRLAHNEVNVEVGQDASDIASIESTVLTDTRQSVVDISNRSSSSQHSDNTDSNQDNLLSHLNVNTDQNTTQRTVINSREKVEMATFSDLLNPNSHAELTNNDAEVKLNKVAQQNAIKNIKIVNSDQSQVRSNKDILIPLRTELNNLETPQDELKDLNFNPLQPIEAKQTKKQKRRALAHAEMDDLNNGRLTEDINAVKSSFVTANDGSAFMTLADNLPLLTLNQISRNNNDDFRTLASANEIGVKFPSDKKWAFSTFVDLDFNQISTPYDQLYQKNGYNQNRIGTGGGLLLHRDLGPIEVSTGVSYSSKQYNPKEFIELSKKDANADATAYRLNGIKLNVLTVPLHAAYYITKKGNWRPYIVTGGAVHLALQAQYEKESETIPNSVPVDQFLDENEGATYTEGQANFEKKKFPDGLIGNGTFRENHYFTIDLGMGIERKISPSTSFFVQPTVYYNLFNKGLSTNNDKINTFSLQIGTKTRI